MLFLCTLMPTLLGRLLNAGGNRGSGTHQINTSILGRTLGEAGNTEMALGPEIPTIALAGLVTATRVLFVPFFGRRGGMCWGSPGMHLTSESPRLSVLTLLSSP